MTTYTFDPAAFLTRINFSNEIKLNENTLKKLHTSHLSNIPFENLDIALNRGIPLEPEQLFNKLVFQKRGGYCFELNAFFLSALHYFGFTARALLGRVHLTGVPSGRVHQFSLVTLNKQQWIVDVGFGANSPPEPIPFKIDQAFEASGQTFMIIQHDLFGFMLQIKKNNQWNNLYSFDLNYVAQGDIECGNYYTSTNPKSIFVKNRIASILTHQGLTTLFNYTLKKYENGIEIIETLKPGKDYLNALKEHFNIDLDTPYEAFNQSTHK